MDQGNIFKALWKGLLFTFLSSALLTLIIVQIVFEELAHSLEGGAVLPIGAVLWNFALTVSASTIFFNLYLPVRNSIFYCFLSYFIVPFFIALYVGLNAGDLMKLFFTSTVSFFVVQAWFFIKFRVTDFTGKAD